MNMIKRIKKKINKLSGHQLVILALTQWQEKLHSQFPNINYLNDSVRLVNGKHVHVLGIYISDHNTTDIPKTILVKLPGKQYKNIKTEIVTGLGKTIIQAGMDGAIAHEDSPGYTGSACCILCDQQNNNYVLTNGHVLSDGFIQNTLLNTDGKQVLYDNGKIGSWYYNAMSNEGDFALAKIEDENFPDNVTPEKFNNQIYTITKSDWLKLKINVRGNKCKLREASLIEVVTGRLSVTYKDSQSITFDEVILLADQPDKSLCTPVTEAGDSGGLAYTEDNKLIGIITAGDIKFSYILPINKLLSELNLSVL